MMGSLKLIIESRKIVLQMRSVGSSSVSVSGMGMLGEIWWLYGFPGERNVTGKADGTTRDWYEME